MAYTDSHHVTVDATPDQCWSVVSRLGGDDRLYTPGLLWHTRGAVERLYGGPGHRLAGPGRPLEPGDTMDFWHVVDVHAPTRLRLRAESRLPGTAFLDIVVTPQSARTDLRLTTEFHPDGLVGHVFWWAELPAHRVVFELMTRRLAAMVTGG
jgi:hypothetical protein